MITGNNLTLTPPEWEWKTNKLRTNQEINSLHDCLTKYYSQRNIIYKAILIITNNEWETLQSDYGEYKKRKDYHIDLWNLKKVNLYDEHIDFIIVTDDHDSNIRIRVTDDFFYSIECEDEYYN